MSITAKVVDRSDRCAVLAYDNVITGSEQAQRRPVTTPATYDRWAVTNDTMSGKFQTDGRTFNVIGIAAHNLYSAGLAEAVINTANSVGGALTEYARIPITSDGAILYTGPDVSGVAEIQAIFNTPDVVYKEVGVLFAGQSLTMEQPLYGGHSPQNLSASTRYQSTVSDTGQFLGRTIIRQGTETELSWRHLDPDWYREHFQPFVDAAKKRPFFIRWRPDLYTEEVSYSHTTSDIRPQNMGGGHRLMSVSMSIRGHHDTAQPPVSGAGVQSVEALIAGLGV